MLDVTEVLLTAIVPEESVAVPLRALLPSLMTRPFPAVPTARFPLVAVIAPAVAVKVVVAVKDPGHVMADGRENVIDAPELLPVAVIWPDVPSSDHPSRRTNRGIAGGSSENINLRRSRGC